jgi:hypothetical protein
MQRVLIYSGREEINVGKLEVGQIDHISRTD